MTTTEVLSSIFFGGLCAWAFTFGVRLLGYSFSDSPATLLMLVLIGFLAGAVNHFWIIPALRRLGRRRP